ENPSFNCYLGNGDPLNRVSTHVPAGRGPFTGPDAFVDGCVDALQLQKMHLIVPPFPIEKCIYYDEIFNGTGYHLHVVPSAYCWAGTRVQKPGKYTRDGPDGWDPNYWDTQPGTAGIYWMIGYLDKSVQFTRET